MNIWPDSVDRSIYRWIDEFHLIVKPNYQYTEANIIIFESIVPSFQQIDLCSCLFNK